MESEVSSLWRSIGLEEGTSSLDYVTGKEDHHQDQAEPFPKNKFEPASIQRKDEKRLAPSPMTCLVPAPCQPSGELLVDPGTAGQESKRQFDNDDDNKKKGSQTTAETVARDHSSKLLFILF